MQAAHRWGHSLEETKTQSPHLLSRTTLTYALLLQDYQYLPGTKKSPGTPKKQMLLLCRNISTTQGTQEPTIRNKPTIKQYQPQKVLSCQEDVSGCGI